MPCSVCGENCRCGLNSTAACAQPARSLNDVASQAPDAWREEVAARLSRYQARRKPRPPRYPSLLLPFENARRERVVTENSFPPAMLQASHHALALDSFVDNLEAVDCRAAQQLPLPESGIAMDASAGIHDLPGIGKVMNAAATPSTAKIIEFPRPWTPPLPPPDQLAEPVITHPRILEAPEIAPPPPALGGITIEPVQQPEIQRRPGIDFPLRGASLARRISAAAVDGLIIAAACLLFAFVFSKMTALRPPALQTAEILAGLASLLWAAYQYLLIVYAGTTPGLRLNRLVLCRFNGAPAGRRLRRWRVLASFLSALSLGMGYAWVFLDEDALCWHDRISHSYLAPNQTRAAAHS